MNTFAVFFVCVQTCLIQNVFSQCYNNFAPTSGFAPTFGPSAKAPTFAPSSTPFCLSAPGDLGVYSDAGEGNLAVAGELPVYGATALNGQIPILGAVRFGGDVYAGGAVSISGNCACGCGY